MPLNISNLQLTIKKFTTYPQNVAIGSQKNATFKKTNKSFLKKLRTNHYGFWTRIIVVQLSFVQPRVTNLKQSRSHHERYWCERSENSRRSCGRRIRYDILRDRWCRANTTTIFHLFSRRTEPYKFLFLPVIRAWYCQGIQWCTPDNLCSRV